MPASLPASPAQTLGTAPAGVRSGPRTVRIGVLGCGAFATFSAAEYRRLPDVAITAVADVDPTRARQAAARLAAEATDPDGLLTSGDVDLVYIATPPSLHHRQAAAALLAGRHVLVEKPLATTLADAEELESLAAARGLVCVANLVERYNPLADVVGRIIRSGLLGGLIHGLFLNEAADEGLAPGHWFWNRPVSGGIFVEHGVHFFDLVAFWLGKGHVVSAARSVRSAATGAAAAVEEQVSCTCRYAAPDCVAAAVGGPPEAGAAPRHCEPHGGVLFHFEHGFHQPSRMDRQELRLVFERGELQLFEWVPTHGVLRALVDDDAIGVLTDLLPGSRVRSQTGYTGADRRMRGRFQAFEATALVEIGFTTGLDKLGIYAQVVRDLMADQIARIRTAGHVRRLTEVDSVAAVALACAADRLALEAS